MADQLVRGLRLAAGFTRDLAKVWAEKGYRLCPLRPAPGYYRMTCG